MSTYQSYDLYGSNYAWDRSSPHAEATTKTDLKTEIERRVESEIALMREHLATKVRESVRLDDAASVAGCIPYSMLPKVVNWTDNSATSIEMNLVSWNDATNSEKAVPIPTISSATTTAAAAAAAIDTVVQEILWSNDKPLPQHHHRQSQALNDDVITVNEVKWSSDNRTNNESYNNHHSDNNLPSHGLPMMEVKAWTNDYDNVSNNAASSSSVAESMSGIGLGSQSNLLLLSINLILRCTPARSLGNKHSLTSLANLPSFPPTRHSRDCQDRGTDAEGHISGCVEPPNRNGYRRWSTWAKWGDKVALRRRHDAGDD